MSLTSTAMMRQPMPASAKVAVASVVDRAGRVLEVVVAVAAEGVVVVAEADAPAGAVAAEIAEGDS